MSDAKEAYFARGDNSRQLFVRPSFYDALSGEFRYSGDPECRVHTLGRLAQSSFIKGEIEEIDTECDPGYYVARYSPSWAPHTAVDVDYDVHAGVIDVATGVMLRPVNSTAEGLYFTVNNNVLSIGSSDDDVYYSLALGKSIITARQAVTEVVEQFFENSRSK